MFTRWQYIRSHLSPLDKVLAVLRVVAIAGGLSWMVFSPLEPLQRHRLLVLFSMLCFYSSGLYLAIFFRPQLVSRFYLVAFLVDLWFLFFLVRLTGGIHSHFYLAFYLLVALHALYYGIWWGLGVACVATVVYLASDPLWYTGLAWTDLALRIGFLFLVAVSLGALSERERRMQVRMRQAERLATIGRMTSMIAHEVRNPLSSISLNTELLRDALLQPESFVANKAVGLADAILAETDRLSRVTDEFLQYMRMPTVKLTTQQLNALVAELLQFLTQELAQRRVVVEQTLSPELPTVLCDGQQMRQVLLNVIRNAMESMPDGGMLRVSTACSARDAVLLTVSDTGVGIKRRDRRQIFEPFYTTKSYGTGLGLAVVRQIVDAHGGAIRCDSQWGLGTTVTITLPVKP